MWHVIATDPFISRGSAAVFGHMSYMKHLIASHFGEIVELGSTTQDAGSVPQKTGPHRRNPVDRRSAPHKAGTAADVIIAVSEWRFSRSFHASAFRADGGLQQFCEIGGLEVPARGYEHVGRRF